MNKIIIVGGGLAGCAIAIILSRLGYRVSVYEKRDDLRKASLTDRRSINLAISERGLYTLKELGIDALMHSHSIPMFGRTIHTENGDTHFQPYGRNEQCIYSVSRNELNKILLDVAESSPNVSLHFNHACESIDFEECKAFFKTADGAGTWQHSDIIIGADGSSSVVRASQHFLHQLHHINYGYKEIRIPARPGNDHLTTNALNIWPRKHFMLIALPNTDGTFTCTLFLPQDGDLSFAQLNTYPAAHSFFNAHFAELLEYCPEIVDIFHANRDYPLYAVQCRPWHYNNKILLIGDAAHAILPFYGQGANMALEDCIVLRDIIGQHPGDWSAIFSTFEERRAPDAAAISELSKQNFIEMRDKVADPDFLLRKKIEAHIGKSYPDSWMPLYSMIAFSRLPYATALKISERQDKIMNEIMKIPHIEKTWQEMDYSAFLIKTPDEYLMPTP